MGEAFFENVMQAPRWATKPPKLRAIRPGGAARVALRARPVRGPRGPRDLAESLLEFPDVSEVFRNDVGAPFSKKGIRKWDREVCDLSRDSAKFGT